MRTETDILIIGGGIAGLSLAIRLAESQSQREIVLLTKVIREETNTRYAQGGVAAVWDDSKDSVQKHIADTLDAGDGLCKEDIVQLVVREGAEAVRRLIGWGTRFDKGTGGYDLGREGGHSENRILHYKDLTGHEIQRALLAKAKEYKQIQIYEHYFAIDLITQHHIGCWITRQTPNIRCYGAYALNTQTEVIETFLAKETILATGGAGQVYKSTTNPSIATGDGIAMVYRAKGRVSNMEFVQFHPTSLYNPAGENPSFLISEAVRGYGAVLRSENGEAFMGKYDPRKSLAPRDIVARAIDNEMKMQGKESMFLDCTKLDPKGFEAHFPTIKEKCLSLGIDPSRDFIPVVPAAHYLCGGIDCNAWGQSSIQNLYACGECSHTGLHGANRLASNSLLEGLVFAERIAQHILEKQGSQEPIPASVPDWNAKGTTKPKEMVLITQSIKELKEIMSNYVGIVRSNQRLKRAFVRLRILYEETEELYNGSTVSPQLCELRNLITLAYMITRSAATRRESRGLHYTTDYPQHRSFVQNTYL